MADGAIGCQGRASFSGMWSSPSQGRWGLAVRPAWAVWMPGTGPARALGDPRAGAAASETGVMRLVPFIGEAVHRAVLAHRRDRDAVAQGDAFELERCEQGRHAACFLVG